VKHNFQSGYRELINSSVVFLSIPILLSIFTHLWNPVGFPDLDYDEGIYIGRALQVLEGQGPQDPYAYDHPYFGQLFLAGIFKLIGYPDSLHPSVEDAEIAHSIEMLWLVPRVIMGILAVVDTFLIYKIAQVRYNSKKAGFVASVLFAVMPITWLTRWVLLDSIQLPFLLSSVLLAVYSGTRHLKGGKVNNSNSYNIDGSKKHVLIILFSGIFLGLAIFTKIPAFTMIPLVGYLICTQNASYTSKKYSKPSIGQFSYIRNLKNLGLWFVPVILIPLIWPAYAISVGHFNDWIHALYFQTHRESKPLIESVKSFFKIDPLLLILGTVGLAFTAIKRDYLVLLWILPYLIFLFLIGYVSTFHFIPLLPALSIAPARLIVYLSDKTPEKIRHLLPYAVISAVALFGLIVTPILTTTNFNSSYLRTAAFITQIASNSTNRITIITNPLYLWILRDVFQPSNDYKMYETHDIETPVKTKEAVLIVDQDFIQTMSKQNEQGQLLRKIYNSYSNKEDTTTIEMGSQKNGILIVLPSRSISASKELGQKINLLDRSHIWDSVNYAKVTSDTKAEGLNITVKTDAQEEVFNRAVLHTKINSNKTFPSLSLTYSSKSIAGNAIFYMEIRDASTNKILWHFLLDNTSGNLTSKSFVLPTEIADKEIEFRLYIITHGPGVHILTVKNASLITY
jgi:Dolichyl-phosphate-mannose-protein mannosyltransferase